jgi:hypothetical protein
MCNSIYSIDVSGSVKWVMGIREAVLNHFTNYFKKNAFLTPLVVIRPPQNPKLLSMIFKV